MMNMTKASKGMIKDCNCEKLSLNQKAIKEINMAQSGNSLLKVGSKVVDPFIS